MAVDYYERTTGAEPRGTGFAFGAPSWAFVTTRTRSIMSCRCIGVSIFVHSFSSSRVCPCVRHIRTNSGHFVAAQLSVITTSISALNF